MWSWIIENQNVLAIGLFSGIFVSSFALIFVVWRQQQKTLIHQQNFSDLQAQNAVQASKLSAQSELKALLAKEQQLSLSLNSKVIKTESHLTELQARYKSELRHQAEQIALIKENKEQLKQDFKVLANDIFDKKQDTFSTQTAQSMTALLSPFHKQMDQFKKHVDDIHHKDSEGRHQLVAQLNLLRDMNTQLNKQASDLTNALKGDKKLQGNWGELQVERILESSGLRKGREYEREANFKDDEGNNKRPDFIINLPQEKHIIIDSKVSLNAYQQSVAADTDSERQTALKQHVIATRQHIQSLSEKNYPGLSGLNAPDFVLMFMPLESAFIAAFETEPQLFNDAFEKQIIVVTPTTLLATLRTVANLWSLQRQNENAHELYAQAGKIYDKAAVFSKKMNKLGSHISAAERGFRDAMTTLADGRGSVLSQVQKLKEMGAPVSKSLSASIDTQPNSDSDFEPEKPMSELDESAV